MAPTSLELVAMGWAHPCALALSTLISYLALVRYFRSRNFLKLQLKYPEYVRNPYSMSYKTAYEILKMTMGQEFPFMYGFGTQWGSY